MGSPAAAPVKQGSTSMNAKLPFLLLSCLFLLAGCSADVTHEPRFAWFEAGRVYVLTREVMIRSDSLEYDDQPSSRNAFYYHLHPEELKPRMDFVPAGTRLALKWVELHSDIESGRNENYYGTILDGRFKDKQVSILELLKVTSMPAVNGLIEMNYAINEDCLAPADHPNYKLDHIRQIQREFLALRRPLITGIRHIAASDKTHDAITGVDRIHESPAHDEIALSEEARTFCNTHAPLANSRALIEAMWPYIDLPQYSGDALAIFAASFHGAPITADLIKSGYLSIGDPGTFPRDREAILNKFNAWIKPNDSLPMEGFDALLPDGTTSPAAKPIAAEPTTKLEFIRQIQREFLALKRPIVTGTKRVTIDAAPARDVDVIDLSDDAHDFWIKYGMQIYSRAMTEAIWPYLDVPDYSGDAVAILNASFILWPDTEGFAKSGYHSMKDPGSFLRNRDRFVTDTKASADSNGRSPKDHYDALLPDGTTLPGGANPAGPSPASQPASQPATKLDQIRQIQREFLALKRPIVTGTKRVPADKAPAHDEVALSDEAWAFCKKYGTLKDYRSLVEAIWPYLDVPDYSGDAVAIFNASFILWPDTEDFAKSGYHSMTDPGSLLKNRDRFVTDTKAAAESVSRSPKDHYDALLPDGTTTQPAAAKPKPPAPPLPPIPNPDYLAWKDFPPGAWIKTTMTAQSQGKSASYQINHELAAISPDAATLKTTLIYPGIPQSNTIDETLPATIVPAPSEGKPETGDEELTIGTRKIKTHGTLTTITRENNTTISQKKRTSPEVPGGLVKQVTTRSTDAMGTPWTQTETLTVTDFGTGTK